MSKANRILKVVCVLMAVLLISVVAVACNKTEKYTLKFVVDGSEIFSITEAEGSEITPPENPSKEGYTFEGWYTNSDFEGEAATLPTVMPKANITYYAKFVGDGESGSVRVVYDINTIFATGTVSPSYGEPGDIINVKDGSAYQTDGLLFVGWSLEQNGLVSQFGNPEEGQYLAGDSLTLGEQDVTLYAQWAYEQYPVSGKGNGKLYLYLQYIGKGNGAVILVRDGKPNKLGFVSTRTNATDDFNEFTFYFEGDEDYGTADVVGRIYDDGTFAFKDALEGSYLYYDYIFEQYVSPYSNRVELLTVDGYSRATITQLIGDQTKVVFFGSYVYDEKYGDYLFTELDVATKKPVEYEGEINEFHVSINLADITEDIGENQFKGTYTEQGYESSSYLMYDNGEIYSRRLDLNGYGGARLFEYNPNDDTTELIAEGRYLATENFESVYGEWIFISDDDSESFKFILNYAPYGSEIVMVYIEYDPYMNKTLIGDDGSTLYLDGYGTAQYQAGGGINYFGHFTASTDGDLLTFVPVEDGDGNAITDTKMYFTVDWVNNTYVMDETGYIKDGSTLVNYVGESKIIVIPQDVTAIADDVFNYTKDGKVSIISVVIHEGVTSIGARAFENNRSLTRVVFESETPIAIDWTSANDPFRWPAGSFIIVVPEDSKEAYKTAWADSTYVDSIKGSVEVTMLPEFEIEDGVLIRYNIQPDAPEMLDIEMPDEVTEIAKNVFRGNSSLRSVDLNNVTKIGDGAFEFCVNLESVIFTNVTTIGEGAFNDCELLGYANEGVKGVIELPAIVTIGDSAFAGCYELLHVTLGENIESIGSYAFSETNMEIAHGPIFIELLGNTAPEMGEKVFYGNIATRIKVQNIDVAIACYLESSFVSYNKHLYIESGAEKGIYYDGADALELDGRAVLLSSYVWLYAIDGETITFYVFDEEIARYGTLSGTYKNGVISFVMDNISYSFKKYDGSATYTSEDGKYTLTCDPVALQPETYEETSYRGYATVTFNGREVQMLINGYNIKKISSFLDADGKYYDFSISLVGDTLVYTKTLSDQEITVTASDGSSLTIHFTGNSVYIYGTLNIVVAEENGSDVMMPSISAENSAYAISESENVYTFTKYYKNTKYTITITVSQNTFTYTYEII